jgi:uncharacterized membrane protein YphA (DoxX/SURF4 family)
LIKAPSHHARSPAATLWSAVARVVLGVIYLYLGLSKALDPVDFLKVVREYSVLAPPFLLNLTAIVLPWFEVFCGALLLGGIAVRGAALLSLGMLVPFTGLVLQRALEIHAGGQIPFCAIRFDCGCGAGVVVICHKPLENTVLMALSAWLIVFPGFRWCLRPALMVNDAISVEEDPKRPKAS